MRGLQHCILVGGFVAIAGLAVYFGDPARADRPLALVTGNDYPPFTDEKLPNGGIATALVRRVVDLMGKSAAVSFRPWRRGYQELLHGRFDASFPYLRTADREREVLYSAPLITLRQMVFMAAERTFAFNGPGDLEGRRVCAPLGYALPAAVQHLVEQGKIERMSPANSESCPGMLGAGRVDFFVLDERIGRALITTAGTQPGAIIMAPKPYATATLHLIVPRNHANADQLISDFNAALRRLQASPDYGRLLTVK